MGIHTKKYTTLLTAAWLLLATLSPAQHPFHHRYTLDDGLPFIEVDLVAFAKNGDAWVRYSSGEVLSRFDGINWTHYQLSKLNLPMGLTFLIEDDAGTWFFNAASNWITLVCLTTDGQWEKYEFDGYFSYYFAQPNKQLTLLDTQFYPYQFERQTNRFVKAEKPVLLPDINRSDVFYSSNSSVDGIPVIATKSASQNVFWYHFGVDFKQNTKSNIPNICILYNSGNTIQGTFLKDDKIYWWDGYKSRVMRFRLPSGNDGLPLELVSINYKGKQRISKGGNGVIVKDAQNDFLYLYGLDSLGSTHLLLTHVQPDYFRTAFSQDAQNNWWYATNSGLVRTDQSQLVFDENTPGMVTGLHAMAEDDTGNIWMGGYSGQGGLTRWDGQRLRQEFITNESMPILPGPCRSPSGTLYFFKELTKNMAAIRNGQLKLFDVFANEKPAVGFYFQPLRNGTIGLGLGRAGLGIATETNGLISYVKTIGKEKGMLLDNVLTIAEDQGNRLWLGRTSQGIALYDPERDTAATWLRSPDMPSIGVISSFVDENGTLWLGANDGLYLLRNAHKFDYLRQNLFQHIIKMPLPGLEKQKVLFLKNSAAYIAIGTEVGVYLFDKNYHGERPRIFSMLYGEDITGGGSEQNAVLFDSKGYLWVGAQDGATRIDISLLQFDTSATTLTLQQFSAGDMEVFIENDRIGKLPLKKRNISFTFSPSGNDFLRDDLYFDINVLNNKGDTLFTNLNTKLRNVQMAYLPHGKYTLKIVAFKHNIMSGEATWQFNVPRLPSENPWIWIGLALVVLGIPFTFFYLKKRHQAEIERSRRVRDALQIRALSNFFNPHFINNALHWVQSRYRKDADTTTIIGRLSENMHHLFENTQIGRAYHSLSKELEIVQNYLKIQQVRFGQGLQVSLDLPLNPESLSCIEVPSMLLQIHAENAVEKGIRNRMGAGNFKLSVQMGEGGCFITIEDDGRGRYRIDSTRKSSTTVMNDLILLFNTYNKEPITVKYDDYIFQTNDQERFGTRVSIFIPKNFNYEFS